MKKVIEMITAVLVCFGVQSGLTSCNSESENTDQQTYSVVKMTETGCKKAGEKNPAKEMTRSARTEDYGEEAFEYEAIEGDYLLLTHVNAVLNCADTPIQSEIKRDGNAISIREYKEPLANCNCSYDVTYKVGPLTEGTYKFVVRDDLSENTFTVYFSKNAHGKITMSQGV